jgi:hypothetical protein
MLSSRKPLAALAAVVTTLAVAASATGASAATTTAAAPTVDPQVCLLLNLTRGPFGPTAFLGGASLSNVLGNVGNSVGCPAPPPTPSLLPLPA